MKYDYDVVVIGGGAGGLTAAKTCHGFASRVALLEQTDRLGGECTWTGCIPSKTIIKAAHQAYTAHNLSLFGIQSKPVQLETAHIMHYIQKRIHKDYESHTPEVIKQLGIDVLFGAVTFIDQNTVLQNGKKIRFKKAIIATGSSPSIPKIDGINSVDFLTNQNIFSLERLPRSIIILGAGPIGVEMSQALARLGVSVTLVEMNNQILAKEDPELVEHVAAHLQKEGIEILTNKKAIKIGKKEQGIYIEVQDSKGATKQIQAERILVATGRKPNCYALDLEKAGIVFDAKGIKVDTTLNTTASNVYAVGDVVGPYFFSHMAWYQAVVASRNAHIPFFKEKVDYSNVLWVTFTDPELASAGLQEQKARERYGDSIRVYTQSYSTLDRAVTDQTTNGFAKYICDRRGYILGAHIFGARAGEIIHEIQLAKTKKIKLAHLARVIHAYPTYSELNWHAAKNAYVEQLNNSFFIRILKKIRNLGLTKKR